MKFCFTNLFSKRTTLIWALFLGIQTFLIAQTTIRGKVIDAGTGEVLVGATVVIKGTTIGAQSDFDGNFEFKTEQPLPLTLAASFIGYISEEFNLSDARTPLSIKLKTNETVIDVVEIRGSRISEEQKKAPLTIESLDRLAIKQTAAVSFYEGLGNLKGVDMTTASIGFTIINTRGFNSTSPVRSLQIIDGVDNQSPGLNFSLGNFLGSSELDVLKVDLVQGASSAYYGPNAFNGVISMETKNPFFMRGLAASVKTGERGLTETAVRWAESVKNKQGHDFMAYKLNFFFLKAYDWVADNTDPVYETKFGRDNPGGYDQVNRYGDEYNAGFDYTELSKKQPHAFPGLGAFFRTGYAEEDLVDYNTKNIKANAALHFRLQPSKAEQSPELILSSNYGNGTTVYQGDNRFSLRNIQFFQNRLELRKRDKFFVRFYATNEDAGDSYDPYFTALLLQEKAKNSNQWSADYVQFWSNDIRKRAETQYGHPQPQLIFFPEVRLVTDTAAVARWNQQNGYLFPQWHSEARNLVDVKNNGYYVPGTAAFDTEFDRIRSTKSNKRDINSGTRFFDRSALYHGHGEYKFKPTWADQIVVGGNVRFYRPNSDGTIFYDTTGLTQTGFKFKVDSSTGKIDTLPIYENRKNVIKNFEFGFYVGIEKYIDKDKKWKASATARFDKNQNFDWLVSPAASLVWQPNKKDFFRISFSSAIRNPTLTDQYLYLNVGRAILSGNLNGTDSLYDVASFTNYLNTLKRSDLDSGRFVVPGIQPEKVKSIEIGYRTTLWDKIYVDGSYYFSMYDDFLGYRIGVTAKIEASSGIPQNVQAYRYAANSLNRVTTQGFSVGMNYYFKKYYALTGNYSWNRLNTKLDDPIIPAFNTPEHKFNIGISGRDAVINIGSRKIDNIGFNIVYKWIQGFLFEGSPQFTGYIPSYDLLDGQISYGFPKIHSTLKVGASNIMNKKQFQTYGGPRIGRMAYVSFVYDFVRK